MAHTIEYGGEQATGSPSPQLWSRFEDAVEDYKMGRFGRAVYFEDDFIGGLQNGATDSKWVVTQATAGTMAPDDAEGGVVLIDSNSTTADQGPNVQLLDGTVGEFIAPEAGKPVLYECRLKFADIATGPNAFFGLHVSDTTILSAGDIDDGTTDSFIGFRLSEALNTSKVLQGVTGNGTSRTLTTATAADAIHTVVDDTYFQAGFYVNGTTSVQFWLNGAAFGTKITATIPTGLMTASFAIHSEGTTDPIMHVDWVRILKVKTGV